MRRVWSSFGLGQNKQSQNAAEFFSEREPQAGRLEMSEGQSSGIYGRNVAYLKAMLQTNAHDESLKDLLRSHILAVISDFKADVESRFEVTVNALEANLSHKLGARFATQLDQDGFARMLVEGAETRMETRLEETSQKLSDFYLQLTRVADRTRDMGLLYQPAPSSAQADDIGKAGAVGRGVRAARDEGASSQLSKLTLEQEELRLQVQSTGSKSNEQLAQQQKQLEENLQSLKAYTDAGRAATNAHVHDLTAGLRALHGTVTQQGKLVVALRKKLLSGSDDIPQGFTSVIVPYSQFPSRESTAASVSCTRESEHECPGLRL